MRRSVLRGALALTMLAVACVYSPKFENGTLHCGPGASCPKGYECHADDTCYAKGASTGGTPSVDNFPGHWVFQAGSTRKISCSDGSVDSKGIMDDYVDVASAGGTALVGSYYCDWDLEISADLTKTSLTLVGQSCSTMAASGTKFIWHGQEFKFETSDGSSGKLTAKITSEYTTSDLKVGTCTVELSGTLINAGPA
jgi:hypothetical protein